MRLNIRLEPLHSDLSNACLECYEFNVMKVRYAMQANDPFQTAEGELVNFFFTKSIMQIK